jgi:hypothetical protein
MMGSEMKLDIPVHYQMGNPLQQGRSIIVYIEKIVFLEKNASKKREITQIKCWIELSFLVNRNKL